VADDLTNKSVAWNNVSLNYLTQTLEVVVVADDKSATDCRAFRLVALNDVDVDVVVFPELPGQRDAILAARRRSEEEVASFKFI